MAKRNLFDSLGNEYLIDSLTDTISEINQHINLFSLYHTVILAAWITVTVGIAAVIISSVIANRWDLLINWAIAIIAISIILVFVLNFLEKQISCFSKDKGLLLEKLDMCRKFKAKISVPNDALFESITKEINQKRPRYDYTVLSLLKRKD